MVLVAIVVGDVDVVAVDAVVAVPGPAVEVVGEDADDGSGPDDGGVAI